MPRRDLFSIRENKACCASASLTTGPGPFKSVIRPPLSASLMLLRVSPGTRMNCVNKATALEQAFERLADCRRPETR
jgi:hypothetical protein